MLTLEDTNQVFLLFVFYIIFFFWYLKIGQQDIIKKEKKASKKACKSYEVISGKEREKSGNMDVNDIKISLKMKNKG